MSGKAQAHKQPDNQGELADQVGEHTPPLDVIASSTKANLAYLDRHFNFIWVNPSYCDTSGYAEEELLGRNHFELFPDEENQAIFEQVRDTGIPFEAKEKPFIYPHQPERGVTYWDWTLTPVKDEGGTVRGLVLSLVDVTERKRAEEAFRLSHRFLEIANRHTKMSGLLNEFVTEVKGVSGCAAVGIRILDEQGNIPYQAYEGFGPEFYELESPLAIQTDMCMCINLIKGTTDPALPFYTERGSFFMNGTSRFLATVSEEEKGRTRNVCNEFGYESVALVPVRLGGRVLGLIHVADPRENMVPAELVEMLESAALELGTAIERVRAEEAVQSAALFPSENPNPVMRVAKDGTILFANRSSEQLLDSWGVQTGQSVPNYLRRPVADALKSGSSREVEIKHRDTMFSFVLAPVPDNDYVNLYGRDVTKRRRAEKELAEARDILQALYDREHRIADVLQRAMVPEVRIDIPGYGLAARYEPALEEAAVGGDFYDVFELSDGRVALVVGDVSGKGLKAAVHTAAAKYMLRAFAHENPDPAHVMNRLNAAMSDYAGEEAFVTVFYGVLEAGTHTLVYANGGHEQPLFYNQGIRWVLPLDVTGAAVGIFRESSYTVATLTLAPDDILLVYTDGITDARTGDQFLGAEGLTEVLMANADRDEQGIVDAVFEAASKASEGKLHDDAAVLVLKAAFDSD